MIRLLLVSALWIPLLAAGHKGTVTFGGLPVPGASVTAKNGQAVHSTITGANGVYEFAELADGKWTVSVEMQLFAPASREVVAGGEAAVFELEMVAQEKREVTVAAPPDPAQNPKKAGPAATNTKSGFQKAEVAAAKGGAPASAPASTPAAAPDAETAQRAADGLLINGSVNNGALTPFAQLPAFGNFRRGARSMYNGSLGMILNHSFFDARSYSVTGQDTPKPDYSRMQGLFAFGGPIKIPKLLPRNGPMFTVNYEWVRNTTATTQSGLVPTAAERMGDFSGSARPPRDPLTGVPFPGGIIPQTRLSPEAQALLKLFPAPNFSGSSRYNFQTPIVNGVHRDDLQFRANKAKRKNYFSGNFNWQWTRTSNPNLYGLLDTGRTMGLNTGVNYRRTIHPRFFINLGLQ